MKFGVAFFLPSLGPREKFRWKQKLEGLRR